MKLYHYAILFAIIALTLFVIADVKTDNFGAISDEKKILDQSFHRAVDDAVLHLVESDGIEGLKVNKERSVEDFFLSLYAAMGITNNPEKQELIKNYIPVITITSEDGYYMYYSDEYKGSDNYTYYSKRWSEKLPYYYEDDDFIYGFTLTDTLTIYDKNGILDNSREQIIFTLDYHDLKSDEKYSNFRSKRSNSFLLNDESYYLVRKESIITCIEDSLAYYCDQHNYIAQQFGITYNFAMPVVDKSEWTQSIDTPSMIVIFQGYPFRNGVDGTYNRFVIAGSGIKKKEMYLLEQKEWYYLYHKDNCSELKKDNSIILSETYDEVIDCVNEGAYACPLCISSGVYAPE